MAGEKKQTKKEREFLKWQQRVIEREREMTNEELLQEVIGLAGGDDYDGCFTKRGAWEFDYLQGKLYERLQGWLEEDKAPPAPQCRTFDCGSKSCGFEAHQSPFVGA